MKCTPKFYNQLMYVYFVHFSSLLQVADVRWRRSYLTLHHWLPRFTDFSPRVFYLYFYAHVCFQHCINWEAVELKTREIHSLICLSFDWQKFTQMCCVSYYSTALFIELVEWDIRWRYKMSDNPANCLVIKKI